MGDKVVKKELKKLEQEDLVRLRHELSGTFASIVTVSKYVGIKAVSYTHLTLPTKA